MAERACTRAFIDYLLERQAGSEGMFRNDIDPAPITCDQIVNTVSKQKSLVLYFSIAAGYLYSWLLTPDNGRHNKNKYKVTEIKGCKPYQILYSAVVPLRISHIVLSSRFYFFHSAELTCLNKRWLYPQAKSDIKVMSWWQMIHRQLKVSISRFFVLSKSKVKHLIGSL